jgi:fructokinase
MSPTGTFGAIEAGGTKFVCALGDAKAHVLARETVPTTTPASTLKAVAEFLDAAQQRHGAMLTLGVGCFGPLLGAGRHGGFERIGRTPKPGWSGLAIRDELEARLGVPVAMDTDVNCALRAEAALGAGRGRAHMVYLTVGTGIGGGLLLQGRPTYGSGHPELGHVLLPKLPQDEGFAGVCPFHGDRCAEGLASGPALAARAGGDASLLPPEHPLWQLEARYLAMLCHNLLLTTAPELIVLGGGVMQQRQLFPLIHQRLAESLAGYARVHDDGFDAEAVVVPSALQGDAGILGALIVAQELHARAPR